MKTPGPGAIDTSVCGGRDTRTGVEVSPADIRAALKPWGTVRACVASLEAVLYDAGPGNAATLALARSVWRKQGYRGR